MNPGAPVINSNDTFLASQGTPMPYQPAVLPPPNPELGDRARQRDWARKEAETYYQMRHTPLPTQYSTQTPHARFGGGSGNPLTQWIPQGPPTGFAARTTPVTYSASGVTPGMVRPTYAYNRVAGRGAPTMYNTTTWPAQYYPGGSNTYIPSWEATGQIIKYTREPSRFRINRYVKEMKVPKDQGYYLTLSGSDPYRVVSINDYLWDDSADAPGGRQEREGFAFQPYRTARVCFPFSLGSKSVEQAEWPILAEHSGMQACKAMTVRTMQMVNLISQTSYWSGQGFTNTAAAAGTWSTSSETDLFIQRTINSGMIAIEQASGGIVTDEEALHLTFNPTTARNVSVAPEYRNYIKGSPDALSALTDQRNPNRKYGLAPQLYGLDLVVENAIRVSTPKPGNVTTQPSETRSYIWGSTYALISSKPSGISSPEEQTLDFSTVNFSFYEQMTVESKSDPDNRRNVGRVVEDYTVMIRAPQTGYLITSVA